MTPAELQQALRDVAQSAGTRAETTGTQGQLLWVDLETRGCGDGYVRLCADGDDAVLVIETAVHCDSVLPRQAPALDHLLALHFVAGQFASGRRAHPAIDMRNRHLVLACVISPAVLRDTAHMLELAQECAHETARLATHARMLAGPPPEPRRRKTFSQVR